MWSMSLEDGCSMNGPTAATSPLFKGQLLANKTVLSQVLWPSCCFRMEDPSQFSVYKLPEKNSSGHRYNSIQETGIIIMMSSHGVVVKIK